MRNGDHDRMPSPRPVVIVAVEGVMSLDVTGPLEVFDHARLYLEDTGSTDPGYSVAVATPDGAPVRSSSGLRIAGDAALEDVGAVDTLLVAGGIGARASLQPGVVDWLRERPRPRRLASVCTGAFLLAAAGLLDGRRATTHWASCVHLARQHPEVEVLSEPIYVRDGDVWTSAGVTAGMDLALALVEEDLGRDVALTIARWLVLFLRRPGNQAQFSTQLAAQLAERDALRDLQAWIAEHPEADLSVPALADRAAMSPRNFARALRRRGRCHAGALRRAGPPRGRPPAAGGDRRAGRRDRRDPADSARPRRCAGPSSARSRSPPPSTAAASARRFRPRH